MYADRVESSTKRSIRDRLYGNLDDDLSRGRPPAAKRQRQGDDKWRHDLYEAGRTPKLSKSKVGVDDLRLVIQNRSSQQISQGGKEPAGRDLCEKISGTVTSQVGRGPVGRDLREKISGTVAPQVAKTPKGPDLHKRISGTVQLQQKSTDIQKAKPAPEIANTVKVTNAITANPSAEKVVPDAKKVSASNSSRKKSQRKSDLSVDSLLRSLGLEKYSIQFQAEEVDMAALRHMTEEDLRSLGIPMGPRKKILLALDSKVQSSDKWKLLATV